MGKKPWIIGGLVICIGALAVLGGSLLVGGNRHGQTVVKTAGTVAGVNMAAPEKTVEQELKAKAGENAENGPVQVTTAAVEETETVEAQAGAEAQTEAEPTGLYQPVTLLFAGDVYFSNYVQNAYNRAGDISGVLDDGIRQEIADADIFMVNQEFPFTDRGEKVADKQFNFRVSPKWVSALKEMDVDLVTLANNHILDYGQQGLLDSCDTLNEAGIAYVGGGRDLDEAKKLVTMEAGGRTIGFLGTSRVYMDGSWAAGAGHPGVFSTYDPSLAIEEIKKAREQCDYLVIYVHWGIERNTEPESYQRSMGQAYIDAGADLVVGSHPHVLQPVEAYKNKTIAYSLGNFVFGSSIPSTELLKVELDGEEAEPDQVTVTGIPCTSSDGYTRLLR